MRLWTSVLLLVVISIARPATCRAADPFALDDEDTKAACRELQQEMQGEYVVDLAALRDAANELLPLLEASEVTRPYAIWLKPRLDYLDVAETLRIVIPAPTPEQPAQPSPIVVRKEWQAHIQREPVSPTAKTIVTQLKPIFQAERVPTELVWLAEVESGFDSRAQSPVGAAGLFQLMPDTAKFLKLSLQPVDQRYDREQSARAAARYLKYLYDKFGDWRLALAAYNAGEGRVRRLLEKSRAKTYDEIAVQLPAETQMYVPKIEAVLQRREGVALADLKVDGASSSGLNKSPR